MSKAKEILTHVLPRVELPCGCVAVGKPPNVIAYITVCKRHSRRR